MNKILNKIIFFWKFKKFKFIKNSIFKIGAATYHLSNINYIIKFNNFKIIFYQTCFRQYDSHININKKLGIHNQLQLFCKPVPFNFLNIYLKSISFLKKKILFKKDNWNSPFLGAKGIGYESICESLEITQITIFYLFGNKKIKAPLLEITYGIERIFFLIKKNFFFIKEKLYSIFNIFNNKFIKKILFIFYNLKKFYKKKNYYLSYICLLNISNYFNIIESKYYFNNFNRIKIILIINLIGEKIIEKIKI